MLIDTLRAKALRVAPGRCWQRHQECTATDYTVAEQRGGGKAHRWHYTHHTADGKVYGGDRPDCGSGRIGRSYRGVMVAKVTCERCGPGVGYDSGE